MSAFCVHGVSRHRCLEVARKKVGLAIKDEGGKVIGQRSESQWENAVQVEADTMWANVKPAALSPKYDAPEFAQRYFDACINDPNFRDLRIYALIPTGEKDPKTKEPIRKWMPWDGGAVRRAA